MGFVKRRFRSRPRETGIADAVAPDRSALRQCLLVIGPALTIWGLALMAVYVVDIALG